MARESINIVIADDHPIVLAGIKSVLELDANVVGDAESVDDLLDLLDQTRCDLLITDFNMPGSRFADGLDLISFLHRHYPDMKIIVITTIQSPGLVKAMMNSGAQGVFDKREKLNYLTNAVRTVIRGQNFLSENLNLLFADSLANQQELTFNLTQRELEVVRMYANGFSGRAIAEQLNRSEKTVSRQKRDAMRKLGISHDTEIHQAAQRLGLL